MITSEPPGPALACPGCGSPDVDLSRGLLCGTCAEAAAGPTPAVPGVTRWRKRPSTVEAIQWTGANFADVKDFASGALGDLRAGLGEARSEAGMIRDHASRYLRAVYGPDYIYRAPETFGNLLERWIWAVAAGVPEMAHASIADIERHCAERDAGPTGTEEERP